MSDQRSALRVVAFACGMALAAAPAAALDPQRFVAGWPLELPADAAVFDIPLTAEVYAYAENVEQLAVLDANGEPLSFFQRSAPAGAVTQQRVTLEASPLYAESGAGAVATVGVTAGDRGTAVTVTQPPASSPDVVGFVLDARSVATAPNALELDWRALPQPFLLDVRVEQSSNLNDWRSVGTASVAALAIGNAEVRHARVPVAASPGGYYRISASHAVADWYLLRATLVSAAAEPETRLTARTAPLAAPDLPADAEAEALYFDAGGALPVIAVSLDFGRDYGWVRADVAASSSLAGPWSPVAYGELFYALEFSGERFVSPPHATPRLAARYWRVSPSAASRSERFELALDYRQEYLRVASRGAAPYLLAAGTLAPEAGPDVPFASVWTELQPAAAVVPPARLGARRELGGPAALVAPWQFPWRKTALWAALCGGVLVVGFMAVRLAREMQPQSS
jgi:hypothetical protein